MSAVLRNKILGRKARVAVMGMGYVGLPLALSFAKKGYPVLGLDLNRERIERLRQSKSYITDISNNDIRSVVDNGRFEVSIDMSLLGTADVIIICVPTPIKRRYTPDVSYIVGAVRSVAKYMKRGTLIVLESTTYPGTTDELLVPELKKNGMKVGRDFFVSFSPERIDPGNPQFDVTTIPKVVGGVTPTCTHLTKLLYNQIIKNIHEVSSTKAAEMTKLVENCFRIVNIGWINEIAQTCHKLGINVWEVIDAAKTKPFGFMPFYPGLGVGGHCIPEDPLYLYWKAKRYGFNSKFIKLAADTNHHMAAYAVHRIQEMLKKPLEKARILVVGATYKKDVKDLRKAPALRLLEQLKSRCHTDYYDPLVPFLKLEGLEMNSIKLDPAAVKKYDCVVIAVDHTAVNYDMLRRSAKLIFDTRNVYKNTTDRKIVRL